MPLPLPRHFKQPLTEEEMRAIIVKWWVELAMIIVFLLIAWNVAKE